MNEPARVSVIVPFKEVDDLVRATLEGLERQTYADFEVVLVDDRARGDALGLPEEPSGSRLALRIVRSGGVGAVAARIAGVEAAIGEIVAFTDGDCVPDEGWLAAGVAAIDKGADVAQGVTRPAARAAALERSITHNGMEGLFATCNVFYRREAYEAAGGFDNAAGARWGFRAGRDGRALGFGEDTLLGWRVARGGRSVVATEAVVRHAVVRPSVKELLWRAWMTGGFPALVREAPELRSTLLSQGVLLGRRRLPVYALLAAPLVPGRRARMAFAGGALVWWAGARTRYLLRFGGSLRRRLAAVPVEMAIDAVTAASLLWGSARSRSIVL